MAEKPEKYDVEVKVSEHRKPGLSMSVSMPGILRADILAGNYANKGVQSIVHAYEELLYKEGD